MATLVERVARAIWETWSNSDQAKPDVRGLSWDGLVQGEIDGMKAGIKLTALARQEARAALAEVAEFLDAQPTTPSGDAYALAAELIRRELAKPATGTVGER